MRSISESLLKFTSGGCIKFGPAWYQWECAEARQFCISNPELNKCEKVNAAAPFEPFKKNKN
ncbi:MAG: hypothetical protein U1E78_04780 [Gammaproteobacteria bacterium]